MWQGSLPQPMSNNCTIYMLYTLKMTFSGSESPPGLCPWTPGRWHCASLASLTPLATIFAFLDFCGNSRVVNFAIFLMRVWLTSQLFSTTQIGLQPMSKTTPTWSDFTTREKYPMKVWNNINPYPKCYITHQVLVLCFDRETKYLPRPIYIHVHLDSFCHGCNSRVLSSSI